jgi:hypothetical protein
VAGTLDPTRVSQASPRPAAFPVQCMRMCDGGRGGCMLAGHQPSRTRDRK